MGKKKQSSFLDRAADILDLPSEAVTGDTRVTVTGSKQVMVENHKGLLEYGKDEIDVNCGKIILKIKGENLEIRAMNAQELMITGQMFGVEYVY